MKHGICDIGLIPCREEPSDKSQMVTQILFGEHYRILDEEEKWRLVKLAYDGYECWIDKNQATVISDEYFIELEKESKVCSGGLLSFAKSVRKSAVVPIVLGSALPFYSDGKFFIGKEEFALEGKPSDAAPARIPEYAKMYLNAPYLWGGRSPFGIDCSGFTQMVYKLAGIPIPRDSHQQAATGKTIDFTEETESGDLAFFDNEQGEIVHTGIVLEKGQVIHASGKVRIDRIDHQGIYNDDKKEYTHRLRIIKRAQ